MKIYKFPAQFPLTVLDLPLNATVLSFQVQGETPVIWVLGDFDQPYRENREFIYVGTGHELPEQNLDFIGTIQVDVFVWHLFEILRDK